jgi:hypothetical protein
LEVVPASEMLNANVVTAAAGALVLVLVVLLLLLPQPAMTIATRAITAAVRCP